MFLNRLTARQGVLAAVTAVGLLVSAVPSVTGQATTDVRPSTQTASYPTPSVPKLDWKKCADFPEFQCATIPVPLDYRKPSGKRISLAMMRLPASDKANRIGSLFALPGGPGLPGNDFLPDAPPGAFGALAQFDIVSWDPRGTGDSRPLIDCGLGLKVESQFGRFDSIDREQEVADARSYGKACAKRNGELLPHMSTANSARDLDLMRRAVGDQKLTGIGISYGSALGATYLSMFPGRSRAMVLSNIVDSETYFNRPVETWREQAAGFEDVLDRFFIRCAAAGESCGFGGTNPETAFDHLLAKLNRAPLASSDPKNPDPLTGNRVLQVALISMYSATHWQGFAQALAAAEVGDPDPMFEHFDAISAFHGFEFSNDAYNAVVSVDQRFPHRPALYFDALRHNEALLPHYWWMTSLPDLRSSLWPVEDRDVFRGPIHNPSWAAPALVIGTTHDSATPYVWAERAAKDLGNARLLTFEADGHSGVLSGNFCLLGHAITYLRDGKTLPPAGTVCVDDRDPFPAGR